MNENVNKEHANTLEALTTNNTIVGAHSLLNRRQLFIERLLAVSDVLLVLLETLRERDGHVCKLFAEGVIGSPAGKFTLQNGSSVIKNMRETKSSTKEAG